MVPKKLSPPAPQLESVDLQRTMQREEPDLVPVRIFCKDNTALNMAVRGPKVFLVNADPNDRSQHWFQCYDVGKLSDDTGRRAFALVNRTTGQAIVTMDSYWDREVVPSTCPYDVVRLLPYSGYGAVTPSMLWSQGGQLDDDGFTEIRWFKDISNTLNGLEGNVKDGTLVGLFPSSPEASNAIWRIERIV